jgi:hypothetical protein
MIALMTLLALRGQAGLPRWFGVLGAVAFMEQTIGTITIFDSTSVTEPGGAMNMQLGAGLSWRGYEPSRCGEVSGGVGRISWRSRRRY